MRKYGIRKVHLCAYFSPPNIEYFYQFEITLKTKNIKDKVVPKSIRFQNSL